MIVTLFIIVFENTHFLIGFFFNAADLVCVFFFAIDAGFSDFASVFPILAAFVFVAVFFESFFSVLVGVSVSFGFTKGFFRFVGISSPVFSDSCFPLLVEHSLLLHSITINWFLYFFSTINAPHTEHGSFVGLFQEIKVQAG